MEKISACVLTYNSEKYLEDILASLEKIADEVIVLDSGSSDHTRSIAESFSKVKFLFRTLDNFKTQRNYASLAGTHKYVLHIDSDELPTEPFIQSLNELKKSGFNHEAYTVEREWYVLGKKVHCFYPVVSPDHPVRLFDKTIVTFGDDSNMVHETPHGYRSCGQIKERIIHRTFETKEELLRKLEHYTDLASQDLIANGKKINYLKIIFSPIAASVKWYVFKKGFLDGFTGILLGRYAFLYTKKKYIKAKKRLEAR
jgi:glycosyltransferase involved in cell wall biosynthesis